MVAAAITTKDVLTPISTMTEAQGPLSTESARSGWSEDSRVSRRSTHSTDTGNSRVEQEEEDEEDMDAFGGGCAIFSPSSWASSGCGESEKADERMSIMSGKEQGKQEDDVVSPRSRCSCGGSAGVIDVDDEQVALPAHASPGAQPVSPGSMASNRSSRLAASPGSVATGLISPHSAGSNLKSPSSMASGPMSPGSMASGPISDPIPSSSVLSSEGPLSPMSVFSGETRDSNESAGLKSLLCASDDDDYDECHSDEFSFGDAEKKKGKEKKGKKRKEKKVAFVEKNPTPLSPWSYSFENTPKSRMSEVSMTESMLSPRHDDEETLTLEDTLGDDEETYETLDGPGLLSRAGKRSLHKPEPKKVRRPTRPEIVEVADDESESSMMVLMRYMGCTPVAYGEGPPPGVQWLDEAPASSASGKEFVFDSFDDDNSLVSDDVSYLTFESQGDINNSWTMRNEEVGVEIGLEDVVLASQLVSPRSKGKSVKKKRGKDKGKEKKKDKKVGKMKTCKTKKTNSKKRNLTVETSQGQPAGAGEISSKDAINAKRKAKIKMLLKEKGLDNVLTDAELRAFLDDDGVETSGSSDEAKEAEDEEEEDEEIFSEDNKDASFMRQDATAKNSKSSEALKKYRSGMKGDVKKPENISSPALRKYRKEAKVTKKKDRAPTSDRKVSTASKLSEVGGRVPRPVKLEVVSGEEVNSKKEQLSPSSVRGDREKARQFSDKAEGSKSLASKDAALLDGTASADDLSAPTKEVIEEKEAGDTAKPLPPQKREPLSPGSAEPLSPGRGRALSPGRGRAMSPGKKEPLSPGKKEPLSSGKKEPLSPGKEPLSPGKRGPLSPSKRGPLSPGKKKPTSPKNMDPTSPKKKGHFSPRNVPLSPKGDAQAVSLRVKTDAPLLKNISMSGGEPARLEKKWVTEKKVKKPIVDKKTRKSSRKSVPRKKKSLSPSSAMSGSVGEATLSPTSVKSGGSDNKKKTPPSQKCAPISEQQSASSSYYTALTPTDMLTKLSPATSLVNNTITPLYPNSPASRNNGVSGVTVDEVAASASTDSRELNDLIASATTAAEVALSKSANRLQVITGDTECVAKLEESPTTRSDKENSSSDDGATTPHITEAPTTVSSVKTLPLTVETSTRTAQQAEIQPSSSGILGEQMHSPAKQSVREVDVLLDKTRAWLDRHNESKLAKQASRLAPTPSLATPVSGERQVMGNITARIGPGNNALKSPPSLVVQVLQSKEGSTSTPRDAGASSISSFSGSSSMSPSTSPGPKKSILEQLGEIRAKQRELEQRQTMAKSKKNGAGVARA